jgi:hypothetical protein
MNSPRRAAWWLALAGLLLAGCASATSPESSDTGASDTRDSGSDTEVVPDSSNDTADTDVDTSPEDTAVEPDALPATCPDGLAGECDSRTIRCTTDRLSYETCGRCGNLVNTTICSDGQICDDSSGLAECRACLSGECATEADCPPNTSQCADYRTAVTCRADGSIDLRTQCPGGGRCVDGGCRSRGSATATNCTTNTDCLGALCLCGGESTAAEDCGAAALTGGYCSTVDCMTNGCDPTSELCVDFGVTGSFGGADLCVFRGGCMADQLPGTPCGAAGYACTELPTHARPTDRAVWRPACWPDSVKPIGAACSSDAHCVGGLCLTRELAGSTVSYCSAPCGEAADCPSYAACMRDPAAAASTFFCMAKTEFCPRIQSGTRAQIDGRRLEFFDVADRADTTTVCYFAE